MTTPSSSPRADRKLGRERSGKRFVIKYEPDLSLQICERIAQGETMTRICEEEDMPNVSTFRRWTINQPELARAYAAARELSAYSLEEEALNIARRLSIDGADFTSTKIRAYDVAVTQLRWSASRRNPRTFSERGAINVTVPIQINTSLDLGSDGGGTSDHPDIYQIEATVDGAEEHLADKELMQHGDAALSVPGKGGGRTKEQLAGKRRAIMDKKGAEYDAEQKAKRGKEVR